MGTTTELPTTTAPQGARLWRSAGPDEAAVVGRLLWESSYAATSSGPILVEPTHTGSYLAGTRIRTPSGEGLIDSLRIGDAVITHSALRRPIKWIGRRAYSAATMQANPQLRPVRFNAGSLGTGPLGEPLPGRDLYLAPMHAVLLWDDEVGHVLVPAAALVNGVSIQRIAALGTIAYVHLELNSHDIIHAEGMPAETFVDCGNRAMFRNSAEFAALYPRHGAPDVRSCVPRLEEGYAIQRIRRRLAALAGLAPAPAQPGNIRFALERRRGTLEGWAINEAAPDTPVEIDILLNGEHLSRLPANRYRPDLDHADLAGGRCGFSCPLPGRGGHIAIRHVPAPLPEAAEAA